jgi:WD40 repeat protein/DNA-directed RNA polymerase subunit RPC12/RpoP
MLISCFQCRQQLDVPEDSAGKRVRCPHCQYVIVVPAKLKTAAEAQSVSAPVMALPSMELDGEAENKAETTKIAPLPPFELPPTETGKSEPQPKAQPPDEEMPEMPSIDRSKRRRVPRSPTRPSRFGWGGILGIGAVIALVVIGVIAGVFSSSRRHEPKRVAFNPPPPIQQQQFQIPNFQNQIPNPGAFQNPNFQNQLPDGLWKPFLSPQNRFKAQFPGQPVENNQNINNGPLMKAFETQHADWEFTIAHRALTEKDFQSVPLANRFAALKVDLCNFYGAQQGGELPIAAAGNQPGKEWDLTSFNNNRRLYIRTCFIHDGNTYHHYLLMVKAPFHVARGHGDIQRFFRSFSFLETATIHEEIDTITNGDRRDNEFTALALHPTQPIAVVGNVVSRLTALHHHVALLQQEIIGRVGAQFAVEQGKPIEQLAISDDGRWLAVAVGGEIQYWADWTDAAPLKKWAVDGGIRCAFTKNHHLLVATKDALEEYDPGQGGPISTLMIPDLAIKGFALSADNSTVAVFGEKAIELWHWQEKKKRGRIEAHDAAITAVVFAPDGKTLASASADRTIKLWNVETRDERAVLKQHAWTVWALAFTPDGKHLASGALDGMLLLWDVEAVEPRLVWAQAHQFPVRAVAFDADGKNCYLTCKHSGGIDGVGGRQFVRQVRKIASADMKPNAQAAERVVAQQAGLHLPVTSVMSYLSPDGQTFVTMTDAIDKFRTAKSLRVWDTATATIRHVHDMNHRGVLSPDGKWFLYATAGAANQMNLLEVQTNRVTEGVLTFAGGNFPFVLFTPDSKSIWVQRNHEFVRYELQLPVNGGPKLVVRKVLELRKPNDGRVIQIDPSPDHQTFLVERSTADGFLRTRTLYASADGKELPAKMAPGDWSQHLSLRRVAGSQIELQDLVRGGSETIGQQRQPTILNVMTKKQVFAIHPGRKYAATTEVARDQSLRINLWDLTARRPLLTLADNHTQTASELRFSPDGRYLTLVTGESWTRITPTDWLLERKALLPCNPNDVAGR